MSSFIILFNYLTSNCLPVSLPTFLPFFLQNTFVDTALCETVYDYKYNQMFGN